MTPLTAPLGSFPEHDEFQEGGTLVWVRFLPDWTREEALAKARQLWPEAQALRQGVLAEAEGFFWAQWGRPELTPPDGPLLQVRGIDIEPLSGSVAYTLGLHEAADLPPGLPDHLEEVEFTVRRLLPRLPFMVTEG